MPDLRFNAVGILSSTFGIKTAGPVLWPRSSVGFGHWRVEVICPVMREHAPRRAVSSSTHHLFLGKVTSEITAIWLS
jgi:hypothetical protein